MARHVVVGDLRVQQIERKDGLRSRTVVWPDGVVHTEADRFLRLHEGSGTQKTYAYYLVDHLRWLERECLAFAELEVAHEEVGAARVAEFADLGQQTGHRHAGLLGGPAAQVVSIRVDQNLAVLRRPLQVLCRRSAGVALDGIQCPAQPPGALQQPDALIEQGVHGGVPCTGAFVP